MSNGINAASSQTFWDKGINAVQLVVAPLTVGVETVAGISQGKNFGEAAQGGFGVLENAFNNLFG